MHVCLINSSLKPSVVYPKCAQELGVPPKEAFPRLPIRTGGKEGGRQEQGIELSKLILQSHISCAAPSKVPKSCLPWTTSLWMWLSPEPWAAASQPLVPAPVQQTSGKGWLLTPSSAQISSTTPLGREEIVSQANCFLDCFLSPCESLTLGAITRRGDMIR